MSSQELCLCVEIELLLHSLLNKWKILCSFIFLGFFVHSSLFSVLITKNACELSIFNLATLLSTLLAS